MSGDESVPVAQDPDEWISYSREKGVIGARLHVQPSKNSSMPDRVSNGFIGGGSLWVLETPRSEEGSYCWVPRWNPIQGPEGNAWGVTYHGWSDSSNPVPLSKESAPRLLKALAAAQKFAKKNNLDYWEEYFEKAIGIYTGASDIEHEWISSYIYDDQLTVAQRRQLNGAFRGMVFGGMGSWNDLGFQSKRTTKKYEQISEELYNSVCQLLSELVSATMHTNGL